MAGPNFFANFLQLCPYPEGHASREAFVRLASVMAERQARMGARLTDRLAHATSDAQVLQVWIDLGCELYDLWAELTARMATYDQLEVLTDALRESTTWTIRTVLAAAPAVNRPGNLGGPLV